MSRRSSRDASVMIGRGASSCCLCQQRCSGCEINWNWNCNWSCNRRLELLLFYYAPDRPVDASAPPINSYFLSWWRVSYFLSSAHFYLERMISTLIAGILFLCDQPSCWCTRPSYVLFRPILMMCLILSFAWSPLPTIPTIDTLIYQSIKLFWYWNLGWVGLCFYVPVCPMNASFPTVRPSYKCVCPVLLMCLFISINAPLLSMPLYSNATVRW